MSAVFLALGAAIGFAAASVLQQREAEAVPAGGGGIRLVLRLARRPPWLAGLACDWAAYLLQAAALGVGELLVVQPVITSGLLFALPVSAKWSGRHLTRGDFAWACVLAAGLIVFLLLAASSGGRDRAPLRAWIVCAAVVGPLLAVIVVAASRTNGTRRAVLLAAATATLYGVTAALTKATVVLIDDHGARVLLHWEPYALVALGGFGFLLNQRAFQAGSLTASLPTLTVVEPVVAGVIGITMLHETIRAHGALDWSAVGIAVIAMAASTVVLSRAAARSDAIHQHELADVIQSGRRTRPLLSDSRQSE